MSWRSDPERDRRLAARHRSGYRRAEGLDGAVSGFLSSEAMRTARRFLRVNGVLDRVLPETARQDVRGVSLRDGVLTLEVGNGILLAELRSHAASALLAELSAGGTGVSQLRWRLAARHGR